MFQISKLAELAERVQELIDVQDAMTRAFQVKVVRWSNPITFNFRGEKFLTTKEALQDIVPLEVLISLMDIDQEIFVDISPSFIPYFDKLIDARVFPSVPESSMSQVPMLLDALGTLQLSRIIPTQTGCLIVHPDELKKMKTIRLSALERMHEPSTYARIDTVPAWVTRETLYGVIYDAKFPAVSVKIVYDFEEDTTNIRPVTRGHTIHAEVIDTNIYVLVKPLEPKTPSASKVGKIEANAKYLYPSNSGYTTQKRIDDPDDDYIGNTYSADIDGTAAKELSMFDDFDIVDEFDEYEDVD